MAVPKNDTVIAKAFAPLEITTERHRQFLEYWEEVSFDKGDFITEFGKVERYFYVVLEGVQAIYILTIHGDKKVIGFSFGGSFSGVYDSFLQEDASHYFVEALTPSRMVRMRKDQYDSLFDLYPEFEKWGRIVHQQLFIGRVKREIELTTMSAKERFDAFMARCPEPLKLIPQKYIASYLNMTPETFSRLRADFS